MRDFYFVGGPRAGREADFFRRLQEIGGPPAGWQILRHATDNRALHLVSAESEADILLHLKEFGDDYEYGVIIEVLRPPK